jgi:hypothetical protein
MESAAFLRMFLPGVWAGKDAGHLKESVSMATLEFHRTPRYGLDLDVAHINTVVIEDRISCEFMPKVLDCPKCGSEVILTEFSRFP